VEVQVAIAFVYLRVSFLNTTGRPVSGTFVAPTGQGKVTVCSCDLSFAGKTFSTSVIDPQATKFKPDDKLKNVPSTGTNNVETYDPSLFQMPFHECPAQAEIVVELKYVQEMFFDCQTGYFSVKVPMVLPAASVYQNRSVKDVVTISCLVNAGTSDCRYRSDSHPSPFLVLDQNYHGQGISLVSNKNLPPYNQVPNNDFEVAYCAWSQQIAGSCIFEDGNNLSGGGFMSKAQDPNDDGAFVMFLRPPEAQMAQALHRNMIFLLDHSGSMSGEAMTQAVNAMIFALDMLEPHDMFAICAFDNMTIWFDGRSIGHADAVLVPASSENIARAKQWCGNVRAAATTDILTPYAFATNLLKSMSMQRQAGGGGFGTPAYQPQQQYQQQQHDQHHGNKHAHAPPAGFVGADSTIPVAHAVPVAGSSGGSIPFIVLITDGAVDNEVQICQYAASQRSKDDSSSDVRTYTFGIGPYCNKFFLAQLASAGRGYSDVCYSTGAIYEQMMGLMSKTKSPVLSNINISLGPSVKDVAIFPGAIPDLTCGAPLVVTGTYKGAFPQSIVVSGYDSAGAQQRIQISCDAAADAPIKQLVTRHRLDILISNWWIAEERDKDALKKQAVSASVHNAIPCVFTQSIAYEAVTPKVITVANVQPAPGGFSSPKITGSTSTPPPQGGGGSNYVQQVAKPSAAAKGSVSPGAMAGGAAIVLGTGVAAAFAFGSVSASMSNMNIGDAMSSIDMGGFGNLLGGIDWGSIGSGISSGFGDIGNAFGNVDLSSMGQGISDGFGSMGNAIGSADFGGAGDAIGGAFNDVGSAVSGIDPSSCCCFDVSACGDCFAEAGNMCSAIPWGECLAAILSCTD